MKLSLVINGNPYEVDIADLTQSPISVVVNGESFEVELAGEMPQVRRAETPPIPEVATASSPPPAPPVPPTPRAPRREVVAGAATAPMPGKIVAVKVSPGDRVSYGDELVVLEAMKMEQSIRATREGVVKEVKVTVGQAVAHGDTLVEFE